MAGLVLEAFESGTIPMRPRHFMEVNVWVSRRFRQLATTTLRSLHLRVPQPLQAMIKNELYLRAERQWTTSPANHGAAELAWDTLLLDLNTAD